MATITSLGIGSGVDINTIVDKLVALESRPLSQMRARASELQTQVSSYGQISSLFSALQTAAGKLTGTGLWNQASATSSNSAAVSVVGGASAAPGTYSVSVGRLATSQTVVSQTAYPGASTLVGSGTMTLELGQWNPPPLNFVPQVGRAPVSITVTGTDTLQTLRDKINATGAGVTATVVTDSNGARLSLRSNETGEPNAFRLSVADDDGANISDGTGLSRFAYDPATGATDMGRVQEAFNAQATINGIPVSSASNEISTAIDGLTLRLRQENFGTADVAVSSDRDAVKAAVQGFADAYNALTKAIADQTKYDPGSKVGGPLQGDSSATGLQRQLRNLFNAGSGASSTFPRLSDVGLQMQRDGTLSVNAAKLDSAMGNLAELKKAFANTDTANPANDGFARRYAQLAQRVLGVDGTVTNRTEGLRQALSRNGEDQARLQDRVERFQARLVAQYTAMDGNVSKLNALSSYVTQSLAALSKSNDR